MFDECKVKYYYSDNTNDLIRKKCEIKETSFRRADKNKKTRALIIKDIQIFISKALDYISMSFKNPITCFFVISTILFVMLISKVSLAAPGLLVVEPNTT